MATPDTRPPRVAFATSHALRDLNADDALLVRALAERGVRAGPLVWDSPDAAPAALRADGAVVVVRSCWDYDARLREFEAWLGALEAAGVRVHNPPAVLRWNARKTYLAELAARGVEVVPTVFVAPGDDPTRALADAAARGWRELVVKPVVSAGARRTRRVALGDAAGSVEAESAVRDALAPEGAMIQPFVPEVASAGEWSFVFFGGAFSHAVRKRPAPGDFRVQEEFGGTTARETPGAAEVATAEAAVRAVGADVLYARVDAIPRGDGLALGELELIEPFLFAGFDPDAPGRFADALCARLA